MALGEVRRLVCVMPGSVRGVAKHRLSTVEGVLKNLGDGMSIEFAGPQAIT